MKTDAQQRVIVEPVIKEVSVPLPLERAFELFTRDAASWWPLASHSVAGEQAVRCHFEPQVGGRLVEVAADGSEHTWGTVVEWQPPHRLVMTWHPGRSPETAQEVSVSFSSEGSGTRLRLVHTGWEALAEVGARERENYDSGWNYVLGRYISGAGG